MRLLKWLRFSKPTTHSLFMNSPDKTRATALFCSSSRSVCIQSGREFESVYNWLRRVSNTRRNNTVLRANRTTYDFSEISASHVDGFGAFARKFTDHAPRHADIPRSELYTQLRGKNANRARKRAQSYSNHAQACYSQKPMREMAAYSELSRHATTRFLF